MGGCLSSKSSELLNASNHRANVISPNGELCQYSVPIRVVQVLETQEASSPNSFFMCNSDSLNFDDYIPSLDLQQQLDPDQIYFLLPTNKLHYRLAASDMAALAVKASIALERINGGRHHRRANRISPQLLPVLPSSTSAGLGASSSRSGSVRKLGRYSSRRAKLAVRSFRIKLNTIYEGSVLLFN